MNRAAKYGDGLFETIRIENKKILFAYDHYQRLIRGFEILNFRSLTFAEFTAIVNKHIAQKRDVNLRVRITFFRLGAGLYTPESSEWEYNIVSSPLPTNRYQINAVGLRLGLSEKVRLSIDQLAKLKTISALAYVVAGTEKKANNWDDCLIRNCNDDLAESIAANLFWQKNNRLYTPPLSDGCIMGVMRKQLVQLVPQNSIIITEQTCTTEDLKTAEAVFLTNTIQGIRWVQSIDKVNNNYSRGLAPLLLNILQDTL